VTSLTSTPDVPTPKVHSFLARVAATPAAALAVAALALVVGVLIGGGAPVIVRHPTVVMSSPVWSKAIFFTACVALCALARRFPATRDSAHALFGAGWSLYAYGARHSVAILLVALLIYLYAHRVNSYVALLLAAAKLLLLFKLVLPSRAATDPALALGSAWMAWRLLVYAFESRAIRRKDRSLRAFLAYGPFSLLLAPGEPPLLSSVTYLSRRPQAELDALGTAQLYRSSAKFVALALLVRAVHLVLPPTATFDTFPVPVRLAVFVVLPLVFFLRISAIADFATGMSNLCGYHAPDAFDWPLLARTPFDFWRRWNIHVLNFLKVSCIFPVARRHPSVVVLILSACGGTILVHWFMKCVADGPAMTPASSLFFYILSFSVMLLGLAGGIRYEKKLKAPDLFSTALTFVMVVAMLCGTVGDLYRPR